MLAPSDDSFTASATKRLSRDRSTERRRRSVAIELLTIHPGIWDGRGEAGVAPLRDPDVN
jgi:hypothetical protein